MPRILLTGATGYVGGRLLPLLKHRGHSIRCLVRHAERLANKADQQTEIVEADLLQAESLTEILKGCEVAFYLVHSMGDGDQFVAKEKMAAENFSVAARDSGLKKIVYLGGLTDDAKKQSAHLRSRQMTGEILRSSGVPVVELRAGIIIGSGSLSFELVRALVERLPIMICPRWVRVKTQPIAIEDLLQYLIQVIELPMPESKIIEIGGPDQVSYGELMQEYARQRGLTRWMIPVPILTPKLSSLWLGLVTPLYARVGKKIVNSMKHETLVRDSEGMKMFRHQPMPMSKAITRGLINEDHEIAQTRWSDAYSSSGVLPIWGGHRWGNRLVDSRSLDVPLPAHQAFVPIRRIGGKTGWYYANWLWQIRGFLDLLVGGIGIRRGRAHPDELHVGDPLDFWRVERYVPGQELLLRAEMKVPGRAWLEFEVTPKRNGGSNIRQTAIFDPKGLFGLAYWYALYPLHQLIFHSMLVNIAKAAAQLDRKEIGSEATADRVVIH